MTTNDPAAKLAKEICPYGDDIERENIAAIIRRHVNEPPTVSSNVAAAIAKPKFAPFVSPICGAPDASRERDCIAYLAELVGEDGGPGLDSLEGWCYRLAVKLETLHQQHAEQVAELRKRVKELEAERDALRADLIGKNATLHNCANDGESQQRKIKQLTTQLDAAEAVIEAGQMLSRALSERHDDTEVVGWLESRVWTNVGSDAWCHVSLEMQGDVFTTQDAVAFEHQEALAAWEAVK